MDEIVSQIESQGYSVDPSLPLHDVVVNFLNHINHVDTTPSILRNVSSVSMKKVKLSDISKNQHRIVEARPVPDGGISGILFHRRLIDGYHRYVWMKERGIDEGLYIVLQ